MNDHDAKMFLAMQAARGLVLRTGLSLHSYVSQFSGETIYQVCDAIGEIAGSIFPNRLERFFVFESMGA
jgi:hypothetical protein